MRSGDQCAPMTGPGISFHCSLLLGLRSEAADAQGRFPCLQLRLLILHVVDTRGKVGDAGRVGRVDGLAAGALRRRRYAGRLGR